MLLLLNAALRACMQHVAAAFARRKLRCSKKWKQVRTTTTILLGHTQKRRSHVTSVGGGPMSNHSTIIAPRRPAAWFALRS